MWLFIFISLFQSRKKNVLFWCAIFKDIIFYVIIFFKHTYLLFLINITIATKTDVHIIPAKKVVKITTEIKRIYQDIASCIGITKSVYRKIILSLRWHSILVY